MRKLIAPVLACIIILSSNHLHANSANARPITMILPDSLIAEALKRVLPLAFDISSPGLEGTVTIIGIANFRVTDQQILAHLDLTGDDLHWVTRVAGQDIRLKLGSVRVDFDCDARIRFDAARQILFIRPAVADGQSSGVPGRAEIGKAVISLVNGREFPVSMQNLKPIIAETMDKIITIKTRIEDVKAVEGALQFSLKPLVSAAPRRLGTGKRSGN